MRQHGLNLREIGGFRQHLDEVLVMVVQQVGNLIAGKTHCAGEGDAGKKNDDPQTGCQ